MPNISTSRDPGNCGVCFLVCNANEVNTALRQKKTQIKIKKTKSKTNKTKKRLNTKKTREEKN